MDDQLWKQLMDFTRQEIGGKPLFGNEPLLTPATDIFKDLHVDGDDAVEFLEKWFDTFKVAGIENFPVNRYFGGEGTPPGAALLFIPFLVFALFRWLFGLKPSGGANPERRALTLGMLYEAARVGQWDTDAIESRMKT